MQQPSNQRFPIEKSSVIKFFSAEREEVSRLKWIESEKRGSDIGIIVAHKIWWENYRAGWVSGFWQENCQNYKISQN